MKLSISHVILKDFFLKPYLVTCERFEFFLRRIITFNIRCFVAYVVIMR